jgi:hypothetical protein
MHVKSNRPWAMKPRAIINRGSFRRLLWFWKQCFGAGVRGSVLQLIPEMDRKLLLPPWPIPLMIKEAEIMYSVYKAMSRKKD